MIQLELSLPGLEMCYVKTDTGSVTLSLCTEAVARGFFFVNA